MSLESANFFNFGTYGRARPAERAVRTAVPCILLIRKRSEDQVLAGPPFKTGAPEVNVGALWVDGPEGAGGCTDETSSPLCAAPARQTIWFLSLHPAPRISD